MLLKVQLLVVLATLVSAGIESQLNVYRNRATRYLRTTARPEAQLVYLEEKPRTPPVYHSSQQFQPVLQRVQSGQSEHGQERALTREELIQLQYQQQQQHQEQLQQQQLQHQQLQLQQQLQQQQQLQLQQQEALKQQEEAQQQGGAGAKRHQVVKLPKSGLVLTQSGSEEQSQLAKQATKDVIQALRSAQEAEVKASIGVLEVEKALKEAQHNRGTALEQLEGSGHGLQVAQQVLVQPGVSQEGYGSRGIQFDGVLETLRPNDDERKVKAELYKKLRADKIYGLRLNAANQVHESGQNGGQGHYQVLAQQGQEDEKQAQLRGQLNQQAQLEGQLHQQGQLEDQLHPQGQRGQLELQQQGYSDQGSELQEQLRQQLKYGAQLREQRKEQAEFQKQLQEQAELEQQRNEQRQREYIQQQQQQHQGDQQRGHQIQVQQLQLQGQSQHGALVQSQPIIVQQQLPQLQGVQIHQGQLNGQLQDTKFQQAGQLQAVQLQQTGQLQGLHGGQLQEVQLHPGGQLQELLLQQGGKLQQTGPLQGLHGGQLQEPQLQHGGQLQELLLQQGGKLQQTQLQAQHGGQLLGQHGGSLQEIILQQSGKFQQGQLQGQQVGQLQQGNKFQQGQLQGQHGGQLQEVTLQQGGKISQGQLQGQHGGQLQPGGKLQQAQLQEHLQAVSLQQGGQLQGPHGSQLRELKIQQGGQLLGQHGGQLQAVSLQKGGQLIAQHGGQLQEVSLQQGDQFLAQLQGQHGGQLQQGGKFQQGQLQGQHGGQLQQGGKLQQAQLQEHLQAISLQQGGQLQGPHGGQQVKSLGVPQAGIGALVQIQAPVKSHDAIQVQQVALEEPRAQVQVKLENEAQDARDLSGAGHEQIEEQGKWDEGQGKGKVQVETIYGPRPFAFKYRSPVDKGGESYHEEKSDHDNRRVGSYGYKSPDGLFRHVDYVADKHGFRAQIRSNEPGLSRNNPANVKIVLHESPRFLQQEQERHSNEPGSYAQEVRYKGHK